MNKALVAGLLCLATVGAVVGWFVVTRPAHDPPRQFSATDVDDKPAGTWQERVLTPKEGKNPAEIADMEFSNLSDARQRKELVEWVASQPWADHKTPILRKAMVADPSEEVQLAALDKSIGLAVKAGPLAIVEVIRAGMSAANARVVQQSLREARKHPSVELVPDLIEVADSPAAHRFLAIDALAFTDDPRASAKVIEVATREGGDKTERVRAVALLSKLKDSRADEALAQLCGHADPEVKAVAVEAMAAREKK